MEVFQSILTREGYSMTKSLEFIKIEPIVYTHSTKKLLKISDKIRQENSRVADLILLFICRTRGYKELKQEILKPINLLTNTRNSCYQDAVLVPLFAEKNRFILNGFFSIENPALSCLQKELYNISRFIRKRTGPLLHNLGSRTADFSGTCSVLREIMKKTKGMSQYNFHSFEMGDSEEFLSKLFDLFKIEGVVKVRKNYVFLHPKITEKIRTSKIRYPASPLVLVPFTSLSEEENKLSTFLSKKETVELDKDNLFRYQGQLYNRRVEKEKIVSAEYLVFSVQRTFLDERGFTKRNYSSIELEPKISVSRSILELFAIVIHQQRHYTCYIKIRGFWYYYDDLEPDIGLIGKLSENIGRLPDPKTWGTLYFYRSCVPQSSEN